MPEFLINLALAIGGYAFHLLKLYGESLKRNEEFLTKPFLVSVFSNLLAIGILLYIGDSLPDDIIVMSPLTVVIIGAFASSMLSGIIAIKKPKLDANE